MRKQLPKLTEKQFQTQIVQLAKMHGWWVYHTFDARKSEPGFPDLVLIRAPEILFWELKTETGRMSKPQDEVLQMLVDCGMTAEVKRPRDWDSIEQALRR